MRVLDAVLRDIRGASPHQYGEAGRGLRLLGFRVFVSFFEFSFERFLLSIPMELAPPVSSVVLYSIFWTAYYFVLLLLFCLF
jgi:hypothetical protein